MGLLEKIQIGALPLLKETQTVTLRVVSKTTLWEAKKVTEKAISRVPMRELKTVQTKVLSTAMMKEGEKERMMELQMAKQTSKVETTGEGIA